MSTPESVMTSNQAAREGGLDWAKIGTVVLSRFGYPVIGIIVLLAVWWLGGWADSPLGVNRAQPGIC